MSGDFLGKITNASQVRADAAKIARPIEVVRAEAEARGKAKSLLASLSAPGRRFIAEVKRASPSKGAIDTGLDAPAQAKLYEQGGAAAVSVLSEPAHFQGSLEDVGKVAAAVSVPVLRKDFLVDPWQMFEARAAGADAALIIVRALAADRLVRMYDACLEAGLEALVEVHDEPELERALALGAPIIGINARNLTTLAVDLSVIEQMLPKVPQGVLAVAESGIAAREDVERLSKAGARIFLVGEALVRSGDPVKTLREWSA